MICFCWSRDAAWAKCTDLEEAREQLTTVCSGTANGVLDGSLLSEHVYHSGLREEKQTLTTTLDSVQRELAKKKEELLEYKEAASDLAEANERISELENELNEERTKHGHVNLELDKLKAFQIEVCRYDAERDVF